MLTRYKRITVNKVEAYELAITVTACMLAITVTAHKFAIWITAYTFTVSITAHNRAVTVEFVAVSQISVKRRPWASNGQRYPLPCRTHFGNLKCAQQGKGYC